jgi:hypothetical protein
VAARKKPLRVVSPDEKPPAKSRPLSVTEAAKSGTVREQLVALRDRVAKTVEDPNCPPRDLAALSRRLMELTKEIAAIDAQAAEEVDANTVSPDEEWSAI